MLVCAHYSNYETDRAPELLRTPRERRAEIMSAFVILRFDWLTMVASGVFFKGIGILMRNVEVNEDGARQ